MSGDDDRHGEFDIHQGEVGKTKPTEERSSKKIPRTKESKFSAFVKGALNVTTVACKYLLKSMEAFSIHAYRLSEITLLNDSQLEKIISDNSFFGKFTSSEKEHAKKILALDSDSRKESVRQAREFIRQHSSKIKKKDKIGDV